MWRCSFALGTLLALAGCGRSPFPGGCPEGFESTLDGCVCRIDAACPDNLSCIDGTCRCTGDACCPEGHVFAGVGEDGVEVCACADDACCPEGARFDAEAGACLCEADVCCPEDTVWDEAEEIGRAHV